MKRTLVLFAIVWTLVLTGCGKKDQGQDNSQSQSGGAPAGIKFEQVYYDFGSLRQGERVSYIFEFRNTGGSPLLIKEAIASCGCTVPQYDKEPIAPGEEGSVEVIFDSSGRRGNQYKSVIIRTNTPRGDVRLTIKANVIV
ncbi:MAG TPA: DUF1573 domain-containing protein [Bacteroidales bacterium]|nr:DUF1573 domain-containing protein [Bacteroidales bacterium]